MDTSGMCAKVCETFWMYTGTGPRRDRKKIEERWRCHTARLLVVNFCRLLIVELWVVFKARKGKQ